MIKNKWSKCFMVTALLLPLLVWPVTPARADEYLEPISPAAGEMLFAGDTVEIRWLNGQEPGIVGLWCNDLDTCVQIGELATMPGQEQTYSWTVNDFDSDHCWIEFCLWLDNGNVYHPVESKVFSIHTERYPTNLTASALSATSVQLNWVDNLLDEEAYCVERTLSGANDWDLIETELGPGAESYLDDQDVLPSTTYEYRVYAMKGPTMDGGISNTASITTPAAVVQAVPSAPTALTATATDNGTIELAWTDASSDETGFKIARQTGTTGTMSPYKNVDADITVYTDNEVDDGITYYYQICAANGTGDSTFSNVASATVKASIQDPPAGSTVLKYYMGNLQYLVNEEPAFLDSVPAVIESRILLPIKFVVVPLGGTTAWDQDAKKATINCKGHVLMLWLNNNTASVDGVSQLIDPENSAVMPLAVNNRILMPLRFVGENLDCDVLWNGNDQEAVLTYPNPE